ncbi:MAG TPA: O-antigen polymerase [Candidatus Angelobacter sp.]|nr:O-antigen polymerase [Candidatus Angelobacter sp.]
MLLLSLLGLIGLVFISYHLGGRTFFNPAVGFCSAWVIGLFTLLVADGMFWTVSPETLGIILFGAAAFSLGSLLAYDRVPKFTVLIHEPPQSIITLMVVIPIVAFPFYVRWVSQLVADQPDRFFLAATRDVFAHTIEEAAGGTLSYTIFNNVIALAYFAALIAWCERSKHQRRAFFALVTAIAYFLPAGRSPIIEIIAALPCIQWLRGEKLHWKTLIVFALCGTLLFGTLAVLMHQNGGGGESGFDNVKYAASEIVFYLGSPIVCFDRIIQHTDEATSPSRGIGIAFLEFAKKIGFDVTVPSRQPYAMVSTGPGNLGAGNVFTAYFEYIDYGWPLCFVLLAIQGFLIGALFKVARSGSRPAILVYAFVFSCLILSAFSEFLMLSLNPLTKFWIVCLMLYSLPKFSVSLRRRSRKIAEGLRLPSAVN